MLVVFNNPNSDVHRLEIIDMRSRIVRVYDSITSDRVIVKKELLTSGVYYLNLIGPDGIANIRLLVE